MYETIFIVSVIGAIFFFLMFGNKRQEPKGRFGKFKQDLAEITYILLCVFCSLVAATLMFPLFFSQPL